MTTTYQQTTLYPMVQFKPDTWELDEFDCASIFVLVGDEKAMVIDTGIGIGDLYTAVRQITDKPLVVVLTHGHGDHTQNTYRFGTCYLNEKDWPDDGLEATLEMRKGYAKLIADREKGMYAYDPDKDITPWTSTPEVLPLVEGQEFDLGNRKVIAYACPGHTPGQMMFLDETSRSLFVGDSLNNNLGVSRAMDPDAPNYVGLEAMLAGFKTMDALKDKYDDIYNGHHDYRALGAPLSPEVLPNDIELVEGMLQGDYELLTMQNPMNPAWVSTVVKKGDNWIGVDPKFLPPKR